MQELIARGRQYLGNYGNGISIGKSKGVDVQESFDPVTGNIMLSFTGKGSVVVDKRVGNEFRGCCREIGWN